MDVKQYFRKVREMEASLTDDYPVLISLETSDGGRPGVLSEVTRPNAARLIVEGRAALATEQQKEQFRQTHVTARRLEEKTELLRQIQSAILEEIAAQDSVDAGV